MSRSVWPSIHCSWPVILEVSFTKCFFQPSMGWLSERCAFSMRKRRSTKRPSASQLMATSGRWRERCTNCDCSSDYENHETSFDWIIDMPTHRTTWPCPALGLISPVKFQVARRNWRLLFSRVGTPFWLVLKESQRKIHIFFLGGGYPLKQDTPKIHFPFRVIPCSLPRGDSSGLSFTTSTSKRLRSWRMPRGPTAKSVDRGRNRLI